MMIDNLQTYKLAGMTAEQIALMPRYINGALDFYGTPAFDRLFEYFAFDAGEMPYGTAKARDGMPDEWILERLQE